ncbi:MAG: 2-C-methyl-D-erythritol 4-phosphate cytidylyltransferase [Chloroflexi bacterium]|nr:2-C-methyl-D-erythritol 4-phosphate cytidylyltransferase [Chloroflexota bacterium]
MTATVAGVIVAAGNSSRLGSDKIWVELDGEPVLGWSVRQFHDADVVDRLVVVVAAAAVARARHLARAMGIEAVVVQGGERRRDSVLAGLDAAGDAEWVVIHDGARPFVSCELIESGLAAARETGAAIAALPVVDTIKAVENGRVAGSPPRSALWAAQTPQVFRRSLLLEAHSRIKGDATDDATLVETLGVEVRVFPGAHGNIKITIAEDLELAELMATTRVRRGLGGRASVGGRG